MKVMKIIQAVIGISIIMALGTYPLFAREAGEDKSGDAGRVSVSVHLLDGMKFEGPTGEVGKKDHHVDVLSFEQGKFTSSKCFEFGFKGGPYTASEKKGIIHFKAETVSPTHGKMNWSGTLNGETLKVDYSWTKERWLWTTFREYWFKGELIK